MFGGRVKPGFYGIYFVKWLYMDIIIYIPILFFSIVLHEFAHGYAAYKMGDDTAYLSGRLTLNPLAHIDPVGTIIVPAICYFSGLPMFGWAKPVPVNPYRLPSPRRDMAKVSVAGPATNLLIALAAVFILKLMMISNLFSLETMQRSFVFFNYAILINIVLAVFNLMPLPPLDGGHIVSGLLPFKAGNWYDHVVGRYGMYIVLGLIVTGLFKYLIFPPAYLLLRLLYMILAI